MTPSLRVAISADLHWGSHRNGDEATRLLLDFVKAQPPDLLILAGDVGAAGHFGQPNSHQGHTFARPLDSRLTSRVIST